MDNVFPIVFAILEALIVFLLGNFLIRRFSDKIANLFTAKMPANVKAVAGIAVKFLLYFFLISFICPILGISNASLIALIGALGAAAALALQNGLGSIVSGVFILVTNPLSPGDWVETAGIAGEVKKVGFFFTEIMTGDNHIAYVPNSVITGGKVENYSRTPLRRVDLSIGVPYSASLAEARAVIEEVCAADARVLKDPAPFVRTWNLNASSVEIMVRAWCSSADYWEVRSALQENIKETLDARGMAIPFEQLDVNLFEKK